MLLSLVDILRCPASHDESVLVLSVEAWRDQRVWTGTLGCPVCHARYNIRDGAVHFGESQVVRQEPGSSFDAMRLAAQLSLMEPGGAVLLTGRYAGAHAELAEVADLTYILLDVPTRSHLAVTLDSVTNLPLATGTLRGAAIDEDRAGPTFLADVIRCLRPNGRLVAPAATPVPQGVTIVAVDIDEWVAEVHGHTSIVPLTRGSSRDSHG